MYDTLSYNVQTHPVKSLKDLKIYTQQWSQAGHDHLAPLMDVECGDSPAIRLCYYENGNIMDFKKKNATYSEEMQRKLVRLHEMSLF
jgi:hypothetical protein